MHAPSSLPIFRSPCSSKTNTPRAVLALLVLVGCAGPLARAETEFAQGRYPEAKRDLEALAAESPSWNDAKRAEYALYRGLTYAALGDRDRASVWLREARAIEGAHPGSLSRADARRLTLGVEGGDLQ